MIDTEKLAHLIVDTVDKYVEAFDEHTYHVDYYHAIEEVKQLLDKEVAK